MNKLFIQLHPCTSATREVKVHAQLSKNDIKSVLDQEASRSVFVQELMFAEVADLN